MTAGLLCVACVSGCGDARQAGPPPDARLSPPATSTSARGEAALSPEQVVDHPRSRLVGAQVRPTAESFHVVSWWRLHLDDGRTRQAIAISDDGFATATYERWTRKGFYGAATSPDRPEPPVAANLLSWPLPSLVDSPSEGTMAYAFGGDGATLFPFAQTARSTDGGETWALFDVERVDGQTGYLQGGVVLNDGRLLVLLGSWSGDRPAGPSGVHHGLWLSHGDDWGSFTPWEPVYAPPLEPTVDDRHPVESLEATWWERDVIWSVTSSDLLYVSTDDARTFTAIPAR